MSMTLEFQPAVRSATKLRAALTGPSGAGKSWTALTFATALSERVAVVDTESGKSSLYAGVNGWQFDVVTPQKFSPKSLVELIAKAEAAGYGTLIVDNFTAYWSGEDGMLEQVDRLSNGGPFAGWKEVRPDERAMIRAIMNSSMHIIVTLRVKTEYAPVKNPNTGREEMRKIGLKPEQRENIESEFDLVFDMDQDHVLRVTKSRVPPLADQVVPQPTGEVAVIANEWLAEGESLPTVQDYRRRAMAEDMTADNLLKIYQEVEARGMSYAAVTDEHGGMTSLGSLLKQWGRELRNAEDRAAAPQQTAPQQTASAAPVVEQAPEPASGQEQGGGFDEHNAEHVKLANEIDALMNHIQDQTSDGDAEPLTVEQLTKFRDDLRAKHSEAKKAFGPEDTITLDVKAVGVTVATLLEQAQNAAKETQAAAA